MSFRKMFFNCPHKLTFYKETATFINFHNHIFIAIHIVVYFANFVLYSCRNSIVRKMYKCKICSETIMGLNQFRLHLKEKHPDLQEDGQLKPADALNNADAVFHCSLCDLYLSSNSAAEWHRKPHIKKL